MGLIVSTTRPIHFLVPKNWAFCGTRQFSLWACPFP